MCSTSEVFVLRTRSTLFPSSQVGIVGFATTQISPLFKTSFQPRKMAYSPLGYGFIPIDPLELEFDDLASKDMTWKSPRNSGSIDSRCPCTRIQQILRSWPSSLLNLLEPRLPCFQSLTSIPQQHDDNFKGIVLQNQSGRSKVIAEFTQFRLNTIEGRGGLFHRI